MTGEPLDDDELEGIVRQEIAGCADFIDTYIAPLRIKETKYYNAEPFGDEREGRSQVVSQDVRDTIHGILPSLMRVFFGSENVVEYVPRTEKDVPLAAQATDYAQYIICEDNPGFITFWNWFKDALIRKVGIVKVWPDESVQIKTETYGDLDEDSRAMLLSQPGVELVSEDASTITVEPEPGMDAPWEMPQPGMQPGMDDPMAPQVQTQTVYDITINRRSTNTRIRIECVPPDEFLIDSDARDVQNARVVCHRANRTSSELIAMGYSQEQIDEAGFGGSFPFNEEIQARTPYVQSTLGGNANRNEAMRLIPYTEAYIRVDQDGDGIAELRRICTIGTTPKIVGNYPCDEAPFALLCPDPVPHAVIGNSVADAVMDIQRIKSQILRLTLDSLAQAIIPRTAVLESQANMDDVLNDEVGGIIRIRQIGAVQPFTMPFVGQAALPLLQMMDDVKESRTGQTKASQGLAADVLQSTTKAAVSATVQAAQERLETIARIFAETGVKQLMKLLLRLMTTHQDKERVVRLRGEYVEVNPSEWDASMDVSVSVGLGGGTQEDRLATLTQIAQKQESIIMQAGPQNPMVSLNQYSYTLRKMVEMAGFKESSKFFTSVPPDYQPPPAQPQQDPQQQAALILAQAQRESIQADIAKKTADIQLQEKEMYLVDARERYKIESDERIKLNEQSLKYNTDVSRVQAQIDMEQAKINAENERRAADRQAQAQPPPPPASPAPDMPPGGVMQ